MMIDLRTPRAPAGLQAAGKRLWRAIVEDFELTAAETLILEAAARMADEVATLEKELRTAPVITVGSKGQERPNALFGELRQGRLALGRLIAQLGLDENADGGTARSHAGRRLARQRWQRKAAANG